MIVELIAVKIRDIANLVALDRGPYRGGIHM